MADIARRALLGAAGMLGGMAQARGRTMDQLAWGFSFPGIDGPPIDLAALRGRVLLVVNTASFCGYTNQYEGLQALHTARQSEGLTVIGVPSRDFNQESATEAQVKSFCETTFGIDFPMTSILPVRGAAAHPFYRWVKQARGWEPGWNFNKVLVGRDGRVAGTFGASDAPQGAKLTTAIDTALAG